MCTKVWLESLCLGSVLNSSVSLHDTHYEGWANEECIHYHISEMAPCNNTTKLINMSILQLYFNFMLLSIKLNSNQRQQQSPF